MKDINRKGKLVFRRESVKVIKQHNHPEKVFTIEKLSLRKVHGSTQRPHRIGEVEYRIGYYIVGKIRNKRGKWTWGQYSPMIPAKDFRKLLRKASSF